MSDRASVGETRKAVQTGELRIGSVEEILKIAPSDIVEETIPIPEWNCSVKVKSLTALQEAQVKQKGLEFKGDTTKVFFAELELTQFQYAVVEPKFRLDDARQLQATSSKGWQQIIAWVDEHSNIDKEEVAKLRDEFQASQNGSETGVGTSEDLVEDEA